MIDQWIETLFQCKPLSEQNTLELISLSVESLLKEPNVLSIKSPITIAGDIHGQFYDLLELFKVAGLPPLVRFLFLGDYVDRGMHSLESLCLLLALRLKFPNHVFLLRGNHESRSITQVYGFYDEVCKKLSINVWKAFTSLFDALPIAAVVDSRVFCCHGGLSPSFTQIDTLRNLDRKREVPQTGAMCDLLWSDPDKIQGFRPSQRGAGYTFGPDCSNEFCRVNNLEKIVRAHQLVMEGYEETHEQRVVTIFSAPNYCYRCGNMATVMEVGSSGDKTYIKYEHAPNKNQENLLDFFL